MHLRADEFDFFEEAQGVARLQQCGHILILECTLNQMHKVVDHKLVAGNTDKPSDSIDGIL